jgi:hypothetical protein
LFAKLQINTTTATFLVKKVEGTSTMSLVPGKGSPFCPNRLSIIAGRVNHSARKG